MESRIPAVLSGLLAFAVAAAEAAVPHRFQEVKGTVVRHGFMNSQGETVIPARFDGAWEFSEGLAAVEVSGRWGFVGLDGNLAIPPRYLGPAQFSEGLARVTISTEGGVYREEFIDKTGRRAFPGVFIQGHDFSDGLAYVYRSPSFFGLIDKRGSASLWADLERPGKV